MQSSGDDGVIIFSLGSYASITRQEFADMIAETFTQIPQKVVWKKKGLEPQNLPQNVKLMDVIPQNDLVGKGYFYFAYISRYKMESLRFLVSFSDFIALVPPDK